MSSSGLTISKGSGGSVYEHGRHREVALLADPQRGTWPFIKTLSGDMRGYLRSRGVLNQKDHILDVHDPTGDDESTLDPDEVCLLKKLGLLGTLGPSGTTTYPWGGPPANPERFASLFASLSAPAQQHLVEAGIATAGGAMVPLGANHKRPELSSRSAAAALFTPFQFDELRDLGLALPFCAELCGRA
jgi:hypothetical protein